MPRGDEMSEEIRFIGLEQEQNELGGYGGSSYDEDEEEDGYGLPSDEGDSLWDSADDDDDDDDEEDSDSFEEEATDEEDEEDDLFGRPMVRRGPGRPPKNPGAPRPAPNAKAAPKPEIPIDDADDVDDGVDLGDVTE
ncbi:MAG: hypothetical protein JWL76_955, partial [Thermoleophilia bacterium]|nr:hypothetical protein [Thermoleophilia bacterium]